MNDIPCEAKGVGNDVPAIPSFVTTEVNAVATHYKDKEDNEREISFVDKTHQPMLQETGSKEGRGK